jgi:sigma-E factor negative regulatory protein RseB
MKNSIHRRFRILLQASVLTGVGLAVAAHGQQASPSEWLNKMAAAVGSTSYQGTVIRRQRGDSEALKVVHKIIDGVVNERVASQEGHGLEIIRIGNDVHCILPDKKSVLVEGWNNQSTLFASLPRSEVMNTPQYDLSILREGRIAGRQAVMLAVRPHDQYRYGHRIWLDKATGFPLQTETVDINGELIQEVKIADIMISDNIAEEALRPSISLDGFTWYKEPARYQAVEIDTDWACDDLPAGFRAISTKTEKLADGEVGDSVAEGTTHILYSDGVANVSVFIATATADQSAGWAILGSSNSFTAEIDGYQVTAVGEVPGVTVQRIASSMRRP